jgi:O-succinylhomoserine sulfhydrylase
MLLVETPSNPGLDLADLEALGRLSKDRGLILNVDNTFATPLLQQPITYGADLVWHSATKWFDGQGRTLGGVVVGRADLIRQIYLFARNTGPSMSPMNAWLISKSLETLSARMDRHCANALKVAQFLEAHPNVERVKYPGLPSHLQYELAQRQMKAGGGIVSFFVRGGQDAAVRFIDRVQLCSITANIGDTRTIVTHPATSTHARLTEEARQAVGITQTLIRISVGLENADDIIADLDQALS